jgi:hypothetical protein
VTSNWGDVLSRGAVWIRLAEGTVVRTELNLRMMDHTEMSIAVDYRLDAKLEQWVPARMDERYALPLGETIRCTANTSTTDGSKRQAGWSRCADTTGSYGHEPRIGFTVRTRSSGGAAAPANVPAVPTAPGTPLMAAAPAAGFADRTGTPTISTRLPA